MNVMSPCAMAVDSIKDWLAAMKDKWSFRPSGRLSAWREAG